jgi:hypothetical protein
VDNPAARDRVQAIRRRDERRLFLPVEAGSIVALED